MTTATDISINAGRAAVAWLNAFLAASSDDARPALYRTLSVEFFEAGVHFIGCDGTMLFRTWVAVEAAPMPLIEEVPDRCVVVMDVDKFALAFMRTLLAAVADQEHAELGLSVEEAEPDEVRLGDEFASERLTLRAFGQELHCTLYESPFPDWRKLQFGVDKAELVDGMTLATKMFATVGKLRGVTAVDCDFHGKAKQIVFHARGESEVRGLLMPMRRESAD